MKVAKKEARLLAACFEAIDLASFPGSDVQVMARRVIENAVPRLAVLKAFAG